MNRPTRIRQAPLRSAVLFAALFALLLTVPAEAFRMIQNNTIGRVTAGFRVPCNDPGGFAHWDDLNIDWRLNLAGAGANMTGAVNIALNAWNNVPDAGFNLNLVGNTTQGFVTDGTNTMLWANGNGCVGNCLALTALVLQAGQVIVESDITFNANQNWSTTGNEFHVQAVAAHEVGHSLGIHHTELPGTFPIPTMFATYFGPAGQTLEDDDEAAGQCAANTFAANPRPRYRAHVASFGWLPWVEDGATAGTTGQGRRMEAAQIVLLDAPAGMGVCYRAHVAGFGWLATVCNGATAGTTGQSRRMEAIRINLTGAPAGCNVQYRAHVAGFGWLPWVTNGATAGTTGQSRQMEALQVQLTGTCN